MAPPAHSPHFSGDGSDSSAPPPHFPPAAAETRRLAIVLDGPVTSPAPQGNAPLARLRARLQEVRRRQDREAEREIAVQLSRELVRRSSELDTAVLLARRALVLKEEPALRDEIATWLGGQGDQGGAAAELRKGMEALGESELARRWVRIADVLARGGDGGGAVEALRSALESDPGAFIVREMLAVMAFWDPTRVRPEVGAALLLDASRERLSQGDFAGALEDRLRMTELIPSLEFSESVAELLLAQGKGGAADEVLRQAALREPEAAPALHQKRIQRALEAHDVVRALGAALDGGLEMGAGEDQELFDMLLDLVGLRDFLVARMELRAEASEGEERIELLATIAHLYGEYEQTHDRAIAVWRRILGENGEHREAREALQMLGGSTEPVVEEEGVLRERISREISEEERADSRMVLCRLARQRGEQEAALREVLLVLEVSPGHREALAMAAALQAVPGLEAARVEALVRLASMGSAALSSVVLAWAARALVGLGDRERANVLAERASQADPSSPRAAVVFAELLTQGQDRVAALALERVSAMVVPSGELCRELMRMQEGLQQRERAIIWSQRRATLRPGDPEGLREMLLLVSQSESASKIEEVLDWVAALAVPTALFGDEMMAALRALVNLDPRGSAAVARRLLDAFGPYSPEFCELLIKVATRAEEPALAASCLERWLVREGVPQERILRWQQAAHHHHAALDIYSAARALLRALKEGAPAVEILPQIDALSTDEPEGMLAVLEARAEALGDAVERASEAANLWREIGAERWGWAEDRAGMVRAWVRAAELEPIQGPARLVRDLFAFMSPAQAVEEMLLHAEQKKSSREASLVLSLASLAAFHAGEQRLAFETAERAVRLDPSRSEALAVCEVTADVSQDVDRMESLYLLTSSSAKGKFGRRSAQYRAARTLDAWGVSDRAARHALRAFEEVPAMGTSYALMKRLTLQAGLAQEVVETLERVAAAAPTAKERWLWLLRAAEVCPEEESGWRARAEILLRAVREQPVRKTVEAAAEAVAKAYGDDALSRFEEVGRVVLARRDGPDGARMAISFALASLRVFHSGITATRMLSRALDVDADVDEYVELLPFAQFLAEAELEASEGGIVSAIRMLIRQPFTNVGAAALRLCAHTALLERDQEATLDLLLYAAKRFDEDEGLIEEARRALSVFPEMAEALNQVYEIPALSVRSDESVAPSDEHALLLLLSQEARQAGDLRGLVDILRRRIEIEPSSEERETLQRELAVLLTENGEIEEAQKVWGAILEQIPGDGEALGALEKIAVDTGDFEKLVILLGRRCEFSQSPEEIRILRLRRAALMEQRLGRVSDARKELESLLEQQGDDPSASRFLADLLERQGYFSEAGARWMNVFRIQVDPRERTELAIRAAQAFVHSGELGQARTALDMALLISRSERLLELRVELERASGNLRALAEALDELAIASMASPERRADLLLEASKASLASGDGIAALERAQRAARIAPHSASAQLQARFLEYQARGSGTPQEATQTIEDLRRVRGAVPNAYLPLHTFLLAEALDVIHGGNAGMRELSARHAELGAVSFIALGMAERLARASNFQAALPFFEVALTSDLLGLRRHGAVALAAADAAQRIENFERVQLFLQEALKDSSTQATAQQRLTYLEQLLQNRATQQNLDPRSALQELAFRAVGLERARLLAQIARLTAEHPNERVDADRLFSEAIAAAYLDPGLRMELETERDVFRGGTRLSTPPPSAVPIVEPPPNPPLAVEPAASEVLPSPENPPISSREKDGSNRTSILVSPPGEVILSEIPEPVEEVPPSVSPPSERITLVPGAELEARQRFLLDPSKSEILSALRDAAIVDHNPTYARALEHVIALFSPEVSPVMPLPLSAQREEPETILRMILRGSSTAAAEALALVWEGAMQLFRRDPGAYGITGLDRVSLSGNTLVCRVYAATARVLGSSRVPLFQRRSHGPVTATVALLTPPAVILSGDPHEESSELLFRLGYAFLAASPEHALIFGLQEAQLRTLLAALCSAFGPPVEGVVPSASITALVNSLWQTLPVRGQRRLKELCAHPEDFSLERAGEAARRISQRAGLFLCGDLGVAIRESLPEQFPADTPLGTFSDLARLCEQHSTLLDLLALAISPEFADVRWRGDRLKRSLSGTFRLV